MDAALILEAVNRADVQMISEAGPCASRLNRASRSGSLREGRRQDLHRHVTIQLRIAGAIDLAHAPDPKQAVDPEHPDLPDRAPLEQPERRRPLGRGAID